MHLTGANVMLTQKHETEEDPSNFIVKVRHAPYYLVGRLNKKKK